MKLDFLLYVRLREGEFTNFHMSQAELNKLREGVKSILWTKFKSVVAKLSPELKVSPNDQKLTIEFEKYIYNLAITGWRAGGKKKPFKDEYVRLYNAAGIALNNSPGPFPDQPLAIRLLTGTISSKDAATVNILTDHENKHPRDIYRKIFVGALLREPRLKDDRDKVLVLATQIESSCFKAVIQASKNAEEPYRRNWDSEPFVKLYSTRCATVSTHIDPAGSVCQSYGTELLDKILDGNISPDNVGFMTAAEMCPNATRIEKLEIEIRSQQHVQEKYSDMFPCTKRGCGKRQCTYTEKQGRSLDEPATILCKCICGHKYVGG